MSRIDAPSVAALIDAFVAQGVDRSALDDRLEKARSADADTIGLPAAIAWQMLRDDALPDADDPGVARSRQAVAALHARSADGLPVTPEEWQVARDDAIAASDAVAPDDTYAAALGAMVEAAAWPPAVSRTVLVDTFRLWQEARLEQRQAAPAQEAADMIVAAHTAATDDPYGWLEEVEGERALEQVRQWNARTDESVREDPVFERLQSRAREILDDTRRIAFPRPFGDWIYNFRTDAAHPRGVWRRTRFDAYVADEPEWDVLLDVDLLGRAEGIGWVWHGAQFLRPDGDRAMICLSDGGRDAATWREFDLTARKFVRDGFAVPEAKTDLAWLDRDTLLVTSDFGPGTLTRAGYARQARRWSRGTPLATAALVDAVDEDAMMILAAVHHDSAGSWPVVTRSATFWTAQVMHLAADGSLHRAPLPDHAVVQACIGGYAVAKLEADEPVAPAGALVAYSIPDLLAGRPVALEMVCLPPDDGAITGVTAGRTRLYVSRLENVVGKIVALVRHGAGDWRAEPVPGPDNSAAWLIDADADSDRLFHVSVGLTRPQTLHLHEPGAPDRTIAAAPQRFPSDAFTVEQRFATSADGTRVPYFLVLPRDRAGPVPVLLYGYGGFRQSLAPSYIGPPVQFLLEVGMGYAVANIRGGGEFGPGWHAAALRGNRQRAFDDFHAVAMALKRSGIAATLGIQGESNGGLLVGAAFTQRPDLYDAVVMAVPIADMRRYHRLLAGASWMDEYGDPDVAEDWAFLRAYSPFHNLRADADYPPVLLQTSTRDDRVHPAHARKMAARMAAQGHRFDYQEDIEGGHGGAADSGQAAYQAALVVVWLRQMLGTGGR